MANVVDPAGKLVPGLTAAGFQARLHGASVKILSADLDSQPRRIELLLDASGSMLEPGEGKWTNALNVAKDAVENLPSQHSLALLVFAKGVDATVAFGQDRQVILQQLSRLEPGKKALPKRERQTALWDALQEGLNLLGSPHPGDVLLAITDGGENSSQVKSGELKRGLLSAGLRLLVIMPTVLSLYDPAEEEGALALTSLATHTGGILLKDIIRPPPWIHPSHHQEQEAPLSPAELRSALDSLYSAIGSFYRLEIELSKPLDKPRSWKLELANLPRNTDQRPQLFYPRELLPCPLP